jgi:hypothetical protein
MNSPIASFLLAAAFCLWLYWPGLLAWFQQDDFAWLGLLLHYHKPSGLPALLFEPKAQGTIRPLSERGFFLVFHALFGLDALPFRIWVFLTQFANLALAAAIARRLTGSDLAAFLAPVFWTANAALALPMSWTSAYNQILCGTALLGAFYCFLRYAETDNRRWYAAQWAIFLAGFGALEINVVYPALAAGYALLASRRHFRSTLPLFAASALFAAVHRSLARPAGDETYRMYWDASILATLKTYWRDVFGASHLPALGVPAWLSFLGWLAPIVLTIALFSFLGGQLVKGRWAAFFPLLWFLAVIGPVLPLKNHVSDYYNALPSLGIALLGAWAFAEAWNESSLGKAAAIACAALYLATSTPAARATAQYNYGRSHAARNLVLGVHTARQLHPGKIILLHNVGTALFWSAINDNPFRLLDIHNVYLTPGSENSIQEYPALGDVRRFVFPAAATLGALAAGKAAVYDAAGPRLRNITPTYAELARQTLKPELSSRIDGGAEDFAGQLGEGWHAPDSGHRWMSKRASLRLAAPKSHPAKLFLHAYCPEPQLSSGPLHLKVFVEGSSNGPVVVNVSQSEFHAEIPIPSGLAGSGELRVTLEVDRTLSIPGDGRELGLAFGSIAVQ